MTCLFIDVVGSTELTMRLGPERLKNALKAAFSELRAVIVAHGGTVEKYIGDAIYALFGAPVTPCGRPRGELAPSPGAQWWYLRVYRALALSLGRNWRELEAERRELHALGGNGARALSALAEALDEEHAAASGGPSPSHAGLRALGFFGWSELLAWRG